MFNIAKVLPHTIKKTLILVIENDASFITGFHEFKDMMDTLHFNAFQRHAKLGLLEILRDI